MKIKTYLSIALIAAMLLSMFALVSCDTSNDKPEAESKSETQEQLPEEKPNKDTEQDTEVNAEPEKEPMERKDLIKYVKERTITVSTDIGTGSGFFIDSNGTFVTNYHVIDGASKIQIIMPNNATIDVSTIVDFTELYDLAVLKADIKNTPYLELYKGELVDGESVCAVGSPVGYQGISTEGMISKVSEKVGVIDCIISTATVNHGNSGGPLVNYYGEVIGVNTFIDNRDSNLAFAVNINNLDKIAMDKNWSVSRYTDWYTKEIHRSYKIFAPGTSEANGNYTFLLSTLHTYQEVTGAVCVGSGNDINAYATGEYDERCQYHKYNYAFSEFEAYTEYIFDRGFEYVDSYTELNLVIYVYANDFDGNVITVYVVDNQFIVLQVYNEYS